LADIRPFHGTFYSPPLVKDLAEVICPPYDIISPQMQQELYKRSKFNFVRIEFGRELPHDRPTDNRHTRAAAMLEKWLEQGVLKTDVRSSLYIDDHNFSHQDKTYRRRSLIGRVGLEEWDKMIVRPHEGTLASPKGDRLDLLWAVQANTSPVMSLYEDREKIIAPLLDKSTGNRLFLSTEDENGESHQLWAVSDDNIIRRISDCLAVQPLYIADGHHRYESALAYRRERRSSSPAETAEGPFDFIMMSLVEIDDPGLVILPAHRLVRGMAPSAIDDLMAGLKTCFLVEEFTLNRTDIPSQINGLLAEDPDGLKLVLYGLKKESLHLLRLRDFNLIQPMMPYFHSELYQKLDVSIIDHVILEELLGLTHDMAGVHLDYSNNAQEAINRVLDQEYQLACLVNPVKPGIIKAIADSGERMPRKSTYFYPKIPAGLVFYRFG
jgi:uncharacterized protein (DUF1015 family)